MSAIHEDLALAEAALSRAVAKLNRTSGGRMPNGTLWVGQMAEQRRAVSLLLKLQALTAKVRYYEADDPFQRRSAPDSSRTRDACGGTSDVIK